MGVLVHSSVSIATSLDQVGLKTQAGTCFFRVVCVGGDGMFSEIVHGLVTRTQVDSGVDHNQPDAELVPCGLRIGIIPAGEIQTRPHLLFSFFSASHAVNSWRSGVQHFFFFSETEPSSF